MIVLYLYIYSIQSALKARQAAQVEVFCWSHGTFVYIDKFMRAITNKCQIYYLYHLNPCYKDLNGYKLWAIYVYTRRIRKIKCIIYNQTIKIDHGKIFQNNFKHRHTITESLARLSTIGMLNYIAISRAFWVLKPWNAIEYYHGESSNV